MNSNDQEVRTSPWGDPLKYRWLIFGVTGFVYFLAWLHRVAPTVVARDLAVAFNADATMLGVIASAYYYLYSAVQPPVGLLADTLGPKKVVTLFTAVAAVGCVIFASATDAWMATIGRALIGAGVGGVFVPAIKLFSRWFRPDEFAGLTGLLLTVGCMGSLTGALPLTYLVVLTGWRASFMAVGGVTLLMALLSWLILRDRPTDKGWAPVPGTFSVDSQGAGEAPDGIGPLKRLGMVFQNRNFWMVCGATFFSGGASLSFQGLWAVPFLTDVYGMSRVKAGGMLMLIPLGFGVAAPTVGFLSDRLGLNRKMVLVVALTLASAIWGIFLVSGGKPPLLLIPFLYFSMGMLSGGSLPLYMTITKELFPPWLTGTAVGLMNPAAFLATALYQPFTGWLLDMVGPTSSGVYPLQAYRNVFITFMISCLLSLVSVSILSQERKPVKETA
ncbi:MAG: MFS transporter [Proteobacteria bacterium]|nr:MFS transporter [Pseudomonadota bacterium]